MSTLVGARGQVTIEKAVRDALGIGPGWRVLQRREGDGVVLHFLPPRHRESLAGILTDATDVRIPGGAEFEAAVDRAWEEAAREEWEVGSWQVNEANWTSRAATPGL